MSDTKKLSMSITTLLIICLCLCVTSFALAYTILQVNNNVVNTGGIDIDLNDGKPVIEKDEFLFEPGMTFEKEFYIQNNSTWAVYYKLYFENIDGGLGDVIDATIYDEAGQVVANGKISSLTQENVAAIDDELEIGQRKTMKIVFHYPEDIDNGTQSQMLSFDFSALAVQTKNNPNKNFE